MQAQCPNLSELAHLPAHLPAELGGELGRQERERKGILLLENFLCLRSDKGGERNQFPRGARAKSGVGVREWIRGVVGGVGLGGPGRCAGGGGLQLGLWT